ncbi:MAG: hypothetical protein PVG65_02585 [Candidatus Thorarchaeota archaeon]|jgi:hypothetical protein
MTFHRGGKRRKLNRLLLHSIGWNEIHAALEEIELMRNNGMSDARIVLVERNEHSSVKVTLRSGRELEEELESSMRWSLLGENISESEIIGFLTY